MILPRRGVSTAFPKAWRKGASHGCVQPRSHTQGHFSSVAMEVLQGAGRSQPGPSEPASSMRPPFPARLKQRCSADPPDVKRGFRLDETGGYPPTICP